MDRSARLRHKQRPCTNCDGCIERAGYRIGAVAGSCQSHNESHGGAGGMMSNVKTHPLARLAPSLTDIAFMLPVVLLFTSWRTLQRAAVNFSSPFPSIRRLPAEDRQHD